MMDLDYSFMAIILYFRIVARVIAFQVAVAVLDHLTCLLLLIFHPDTFLDFLFVAAIHPGQRAVSNGPDSSSARFF